MHPSRYWNLVRDLAKQFSEERHEHCVPRIVAGLRATDDRIRILHADVLGEMGSAAADAVDELTALLSEEHYALRASAALALCGIGREAHASIGRLAYVFQHDEHLRVRSAAAAAIAHIEHRPDVLITLFKHAICDPAADIRFMGTCALLFVNGRTIPVHENRKDNVVISLARALRDTDARVRLAATLAFQQLDPSELMPNGKPSDDLLIIAALLCHTTKHDTDGDVKHAAGLTARYLGRGVVGAVDTYNREALEIATSRVLFVLQRHVQRLTTQRELIAEDVDYLINLLGSDSADRFYALVMLENTDPEDFDVIQHIARAFEDRDSLVRMATLHTLGLIGSEEEPSVEAVFSGYGDSHLGVSALACWAFDRIDNSKDPAHASLKASALPLMFSSTPRARSEVMNFSRQRWTKYLGSSKTCV